MNAWGPAGCRTKEGLIVEHLLKQSDHLIPAFKLTPAPVKRLLAKALLHQAITATENKEKEES